MALERIKKYPCLQSLNQCVSIQDGSQRCSLIISGWVELEQRSTARSEWRRVLGASGRIDLASQVAFTLRLIPQKSLVVNSLMAVSSNVSQCHLLRQGRRQTPDAFYPAPVTPPGLALSLLGALHSVPARHTVPLVPEQSGL